uniref:Uncharacterized protein n=1 Tax=Octopus bimaculoides TaxID=37653 RepID=A0A0L8GZS2_OCTBM
MNQSQVHWMVFAQWIEIEVRIYQRETIDKREQIIIKEKIRKQRDILMGLVDIIKFLVKQNWILRDIMRD